jgi:hypothetical protein
MSFMGGILWRSQTRRRRTVYALAGNHDGLIHAKGTRAINGLRGDISLVMAL